MTSSDSDVALMLRVRKGDTDAFRELIERHQRAVINTIHRAIGDAWEARSSAESPRDYLRVKLDDPSLPEPLNAALFWSENGAEAQLVWSRRREER